MIGSALSRFRITEKLGNGGFSEVFPAMDHPLARIRPKS
jgi:hypothetical protein